MAEQGPFNPDTFSVDSRILCPNTGEVCPSRERLVKDYERDFQYSSQLGDVPSEMAPHLDGIKLFMRLREYDTVARVTDCSNRKEGECAVRLTMNESAMRTGIVQSIRQVVGRLQSSR